MKYRLTLDDDISPFEGWSFIHFQTQLPAYLFADRLNSLYQMRLARVDDMVGDNEVPWPMYMCREAHMDYYMLERPAAASAAPWQPGDKLLALCGRDADVVAEDICDDLMMPTTPDDGDLLAAEHAVLVQAMLADFTVATLLDFDTTGLSRRGQRERQMMQDFCQSLLDYIDRRRLDVSDDPFALE